MEFQKQNHSISEEEANKFIEANKKRNPNGIIRFAYEADQVKELLSQPGVSHLGIYYGYDDEKGAEVLVLSGLSKDGKKAGSTYLEIGVPCPPFCG
ncbi:MAG: hypothetical protein KJ799_13375 [Bacteroidetes bacterium]|nr:hypothetical protein [Bacteroidota bacterium]MBU1680879.1 hypothetical protein [Bacteroidota bacterium]MBU2507697.1 hypothetical protein [Bacteroidota bacterium]